MSYIMIEQSVKLFVKKQRRKKNIRLEDYNKERNILFLTLPRTIVEKIEPFKFHMNDFSIDMLDDFSITAKYTWGDFERMCEDDIKETVATKTIYFKVPVELISNLASYMEKDDDFKLKLLNVLLNVLSMNL